MVAGKRPMLLPVLDREVARFLTGTKYPALFWRPIWSALRDDEDLVSCHRDLKEGLGRPEVSLLRVADAVCWMHATGRN